MHNRVLVGTRINELRKEQGLSLRKLANMIGMDYKYICEIENAKGNPTLDVLTKIAGGLDVEVVELFAENPDTEYTVTTV